MSLLVRTRFSAGRCLFPLYSIQSSFYSTKSTPFTPKPQRLTNNARTPKPSQASTTVPEGIHKLTGSVTDWPKPIEIPYQAKAANSLNLIGRVKTPVQFDSASDGNNFAAAVVSQESVGGNGSLLIPVLFEGDLAHVVACHVKQNDRVFVSGQLSTGPMRFAFTDGLGTFHIVAENINFIEGSVKNVPGKKYGVSIPVDQTEKHFDKNTEEIDNNNEFSHKWKEAIENAKVKNFSGESDWTIVSVTKQSEFDSRQEKEDAKSGENVTNKKIGDSSLDAWRDLVKNPNQWFDYRGHKSNGLVKEKFPDFKHKETGNALWVNSAPDWILPGLQKLEFDVKVMKAKFAPGGEFPGEKREFAKAKQVQGGKGEDSWKSLVETPHKWWDNRVGKKNPRSPDFKHKETGEGLWLSDAPDWALSK